jgi:PhnB protein
MALSTNPNAIPDSYHRVTPCLAAQGGDDALKLQRSPQDQFYGDRDGCVIDPFGHGWIISTHVEDVEPAEMTRPMAEMKGV